MEGEACHLHEKCPDLAENRILRVGEGGRDEHAVILQNPADLGKGLLRLRHNVQCVGHDHHVEGLVCIGQAEHILHRKVQLCRAVIPLRLCDHLRRDVCRLDVRRRVHDLLCDQPRAGCQLQHRFGFHRRPDQLIHLFIRRPILSHKAVVTTGISVPKILSFFHSRCPYHFFVSLPPCTSQKGFKVPLDFPVRASVPPLPGVFQQGGTCRAKRLAPCPMHPPGNTGAP